MKILYASSEALPFSSSGGLGDVMGSLPVAILDQTHRKADVRIILPLYRFIKDSFMDSIEFICDFTVELSWRKQYCGLFKTVYEGVIYYFVDNEYYFSRKMLYGDYDDCERFAFFSKAIIDSMPYLDFYPDILHANDWHTAASVIYLKTLYSNIKQYQSIKCVFTMHNLEYQGCFDDSAFFDVFGFNENSKKDIYINGRINLLSGAVKYTDTVTTVSQTYAQEIKSFEYSGDLYNVINENQHKIHGIINGIDTNYYSPETNCDIAANYSSKNITGKITNKRLIQGLCRLPIKENSPLICIVSRLVEHKGIGLITEIINNLLQKDIQLIILGTGEKKYEDYFLSKAKQYSDKLSVNIKYDKAFSKMIYAGADIFLMPSLIEPCGVAQMIASRYGTVPIVRKTGGLADTITDNVNGFVFETKSPYDMLNVINRTITEYNNILEWSNLIKRIMEIDFSWKTSAKKYIKLYESLL